MRKIGAILLVLLAMTSIVFAKPKEGLSEPQRKEAAEVARHTSLSEQEIKKYINMGLAKEEIYICYTVWQFTDVSMDDIVQVYLDENRDLEMLLKDFEISSEDFEKRYEAMFPEKENPIRRANVPWLKAPYKF